MKHLLVIMGLLTPAAASAQMCCLPTYTNLPCSTCGSGDTLTTEHKWAITNPGTLTLSGTAFTIRVDAKTLMYSLYWKDQSIATSSKLYEMKVGGADKARDLQEAGVALN